MAGATGCAGSADAQRPASAPAPSDPSSASHAKPGVVTVSRTIITPGDAASIDELFARARLDFAEQRFDAAAREFDRVVELDPDGPRAKEAWFNGAASRDAAGDLEGAAARYQEVARRYPTETRAREALVRSVRILAHLERWSDAGEAADRLLGKLNELAPLERTVAYSGKALSLLSSTDPEAAAYFINKARDVVDAERLDAAGAIPRDLAQLYFALGELRRLRGERVGFDPVPKKFAEVLEQRCQLLLDAQSAYSDAMRAYDAHWSAMAGFRVGELYQKLHDELMRVPPPAAAGTPERVRLFEGAMRLRYAVLLQKGLTMMEHTLSLAERTGERSGWVERAASARQAILHAVRREDEALAKLPYSRADLERALADLTDRAQRLERGERRQPKAP